MGTEGLWIQGQSPGEGPWAKSPENAFSKQYITMIKGAITSELKHAIKLKTRPARLAQLLQPSLAFCFSLQPMTAYRPVLHGTPSLAAS